MNNIKKILIFQTAFIGDVVLITSLIRETHNLFPNAELDVLLIPSTANILSNNPYIHKILIYDKKKKQFSIFINTILMIKHEKYDLVLSPHHSMRTGIVLWLSGIKKRVGYGKWASRRFFNIKVEHFRGVHKIYKLLNLLSPFTDQKLNIETELFPSETDISFAKSLCFSLHNKKILVAPGSVWQTKCWPKEYYAETIKQLLGKGYNVVLSGSPSEMNLCEEIISSIPESLKSGIISAAGKTNLIQSAALLSQCDLVLCNDSGTLHIGNAMNVPVFAFFGPTLKRFGYYPYRETDFIFETDLECRPCGTHGPSVCPLLHHNCMRNIQPEIVILKILDFFKDK